MGNDRIVCQLFGESVLEYLERKHRGGVSGAKGNNFENFFAVYLVASLVPEDLQENSNIHIATQLKHFVDDMVVSDCNKGNKRHYQLKNSNSVSWTVGLHPIKDDFRMQKELNDRLGVESTTTILVCSDAARTDRLRRQIPAGISSHTQVENFGYAETLNATLQLEDKLRDAIQNLCAFDDTDKLERLGTLILGEWYANCGEISKVSELWKLVLKHEPNYVKSDRELSIPVTLKKILVQIDGFFYTIENGYFVWQMPDWHMEGKYPYPVDSKRFEDFICKIVEVSPTRLEDLENLLV